MTVGRTRVSPYRVAIHEAAHAVARIHVGAVPTPVEIYRNGSGMSHGTGEVWTSSSRGQYVTWDLLIVLLAGALAEARVAKRDSLWILLSAGRVDYQQAQALFRQLIDDGYARDMAAAHDRAEEETRAFLRLRWKAIERVARPLAQRGRLEAAEVVALAGI